MNFEEEIVKYSIKDKKLSKSGNFYYLNIAFSENIDVIWIREYFNYFSSLKSVLISEENGYPSLIDAQFEDNYVYFMFEQKECLDSVLNFFDEFKKVFEIVNSAYEEIVESLSSVTIDRGEEEKINSVNEELGEK